MAIGVALGVLLLAVMQYRSIIRYGPAHHSAPHLRNSVHPNTPGRAVLWRRGPPTLAPAPTLRRLLSTRIPPPLPHSNMTEIESWIVKKAKSRERKQPFVYPYAHSLWENIRYGAWPRAMLAVLLLLIVAA